jgi:hypothetical protein
MDAPKLLSFRSLFLLFCGLFCAYMGACCTIFFGDLSSARLALPTDALARRAGAAPAAPLPLDEAAEKARVRAELGRGAWNLLHRLAAAFDKQPTPARSAEAEAFFSGLGALYPCADCAAHFRELLQAHPVDARDNRRLSTWLCRVHNLVNERLGKAQFSCELDALKERWGSCGCFDPPNATSSAAGAGAAAAAGGGLRAALPPAPQ